MNSVPSLDTFIASALLSEVSKNSWVEEPGFDALYVRISRRILEGSTLKKTLDIATVEASCPGEGTFTKLVERLKETYPELPIYVENVLNARFVGLLTRLGFKPHAHLPMSFYYIKEKQHVG